MAGKLLKRDRETLAVITKCLEAWRALDPKGKLDAWKIITIMVETK